MTAQAWIKCLALKTHPEGGYYRETYRSAQRIPRRVLPGGYRGARAASTAIYFLLKRGQVSRLHRIRSDELWHHYTGGSLTIHCLHPTGGYTQVRLGLKLDRGEQPQIMIPAGTWFGATLVRGAPFALVGCTVAPGFEFDDFEMGRASVLRREFPAHKAIITQLCRV